MALGHAGQRLVLERFERALGREVHQLALAPLDLWQQLFNRLRWQAPASGELAAALTRELARRRRHPSRIWLQARIRPRESEALLATLPFPEGRSVERCAISPDGRLALAAADYWLAVYDLTRRALVAVQRTGQSVPKDIVFSADGSTAALITPGAVQLYDIAADRLTTGLAFEFLDPLHGLQAAVFLPDRLLVLSEKAREVAFLDGRTGEVLGRLHDAPCWCSAFSADGRLLLTASAVLPRDIGKGAGAVLTVWDRELGRRLDAFSGQRTTITTCAFAPDGSRAVCGEAGGLVTARALPRGEPAVLCDGHTAGVNACALSADGRLLLTASADQTLGLWDAATGRRQASLSGHAGAVTTCALARDGRSALSGSWDGTLKLWDLSAAAVGDSPAPAHRRDVTDCAFAPDGRLLVSAGRDGDLRLWEVPTGECSDRLSGHEGQVNACAFAPAGDLIVSCGDDHTLRLWDVHTAATRRVFAGHEGSVVAGAFAPDGALVVSVAHDETVRLWETTTGECRAVLRGHRYDLRTCAFSPDGRYVASAGNDTTVRLWRVADGSCLAVLEGNAWPVLHCAFSPDGRLLAAAGIDNRIRLWTVPAGAPYATLSGHRWASDHDGIRFCHFAPDGRRLASGAFDATLRVWDVAGKAQLWEFTEPGEVRRYPRAAAWSPDGRLLAAGFEASLHLLEAASGRRLHTYTCAGDVWTVAFSPDGACIAVGEIGGAVALLEIVAGRGILEEP